ETPILSVQQRLHAQDSTWFMMSGGMAIDFDRIVIPAMVTREYGESLPDWLRPEFERDVLSGPSVVIDGVEYWSFWEENESIENLVALREADLYTFLSQYQQEPIALGGNVFKSEWWRYYGDSDKAHEPRPDKFEYTFITADTAQKTNELNDYSVLCYWGKYRDRVYFIDGIRGKWEAPDLRVQAEAFIKQCWRRNKECGNLRRIYIEDKASGTGLIQDLTKAVNGMGEIVPVQRDKDKVTRAMDAQPIIKGGRVV
ncbi:phage terminase large subunit, partial [Escherichia coli]|uniref:phage terminase large subunit n=1 Tax=Escherichia coli TaxID=562 RepID=UPI001F4465EE